MKSLHNFIEVQNNNAQQQFVYFIVAIGYNTWESF